MSDKKEKRKSGLFGRGSKKGKPEEPQLVVQGEEAAKELPTTPEVPSAKESKKSKRKSVSLKPSTSSEALTESESPKEGRKRVCTKIVVTFHKPAPSPVHDTVTRESF